MQHDETVHKEYSVDWMQIEQVQTSCPICSDSVFAAAGRGYCPDCFVTFPLKKQTRKEMLSVFLLRYYMSRNSPFYHRAGCKYLKNVDPQNLIELTEPSGKPCRCVSV